MLIFLNEQRFLQEAIDSVIAQTYPHWELLLVNDGSTDHSLDIARLNAKRDPNRIRYLTHENGMNRGKSVSRNLGLHSARGDYIAFLDGDDVFRPEKIERQTTILSKSPAAMVYGPTLYWNNWPGAPIPPQCDQMGRLGVTPNRLYEPPGLLTMFLKDGGTVPCICGLTVRRSVALQVGGFDERIQDLYEDQIFLAKICSQFPVYVESGWWDQYRQHPNSSSQLAIASGSYHPTRANPSRLAFLRWLLEYLSDERIQDPALERALHRALWPYTYPRLYRTVCFGQRIVFFGATLPKRAMRRLLPRR